MRGLTTSASGYHHEETAVSLRILVAYNYLETLNRDARESGNSPRLQVRAYLHLRVTTALSPVLPCLFALFNLYKIFNIIDDFRTNHFAHGLLCVQLLIQIWHLLSMDKCKHA